MIIFIVLECKVLFNWKSSTKTKCIKEYHSKVFSYFAMEVTKLLLKYYTSLMQVVKVLKVSCRYWWWSCTLAIWDLGLVHVYIVASEMLCVLKKLNPSLSHEGA